MSMQRDPLADGAAPDTNGAADLVRSMDVDAVLARVDGDWALLRELVGLFLEECPRRIGEIQAALVRRDASGLASAAHGLKGTLSYFGAGAAIDAVNRLERMGRDGDLGDAEAACATLEQALAHLTPALDALTLKGRA